MSNRDFETALVSPVDHIAAAVADFILFVPLLTLVLAPLRKEILIAQIVNDMSGVLFLATGAVIITLLGLVVYQTVFIALWEATPGKMILKMKVVSVFKPERVSWSVALLRSVCWCLGIVSFGLSWLGIFSDPRRRPFHDRLADTRVLISDERRFTKAPSPLEVATVAGIRSAVLVFTLICGVQLATSVFQRQDLSSSLWGAAEEESNLCEIVTVAQQNWMGEKNPTRIDVALALHAADRLEDKCLEAEADQNFLQNRNLESSYLAKALVRQDDEKSFLKYKMKICDSYPKGTGCRLLTGLKTAEELDLDDKWPEYMKIWALRVSIEKKQYATALNFLSEPAPSLELAYYFASNRLKVLRDLNQNSRAQTEFSAAFNGLNREERIDLAKESCISETELGCSVEHASEHMGCDLLYSMALKNRPTPLDSLETSLALTRYASCAVEPRKPLAELKEILSPGVQAYAEALELKFQGKNLKAVENLKKIVSSADETSLSLEALSSLIEQDPKSVRNAFLVWAEADEEQMGWRHLGWGLSQKLLSSGHALESLQVGLRLKKSGFNPVELQRTLIVAAYKSGNLDSAQALLAAYAGTEAPSREPASIQEVSSEFTTIYHKLLDLRTQAAHSNRSDL
jgi:uncharacterized RDD family membrane protein YckC